MKTENKTRCPYAAPAQCNTNDLTARGNRAKIKRNDAGTKAERIEDKLTLFVIIIGIAYFIVMTSRLFLNF